MAPVDVHRVVVLGAGQVGKTALINRFITGEYEDSYSPTLEDLHKHVHMLPGGKAHHIEILDTSGSHEFPAMRQLAIQSGRGFLIVYALNDTDSFKEAIELVKHVKEEKGEGVPVCLCGNKTDLDIQDRSSHGENFLTSVIQLEASAKTNSDVETVFLAIFNELVNDTTIPITISDKRKGSIRDRIKQRLSLLRRDKSPLRRRSDGESLNVDDDVTPMPRSRVQTFSSFCSLLKKGSHTPPELLPSKPKTQRRKSIGNPESFDDAEDSPEFTSSNFRAMPRRHSTHPIPLRWESNESELNEKPKETKIENANTTRVKTCVESVFDSPETTRACRVISLNQAKSVAECSPSRPTEFRKYSAPESRSTFNDLLPTGNESPSGRRRRTIAGQIPQKEGIDETILNVDTLSNSTYDTCLRRKSLMCIETRVVSSDKKNINPELVLSEHSSGKREVISSITVHDEISIYGRSSQKGHMVVENDRHLRKSDKDNQSQCDFQDRRQCSSKSVPFNLSLRLSPNTSRRISTFINKNGKG